MNVNTNIFFPSNYSKIGHRKWDHICWLHSDNKGKIYVNAELSSVFELTSGAFDFMDGYRDTTFDMMLGQEPDSWIGDFNPKQTLRGRISEFNVWNSKISFNMVSEMAKCKTRHQGNIAKWEIGNLVFYNTSAQSMQYEDFCAPSEKLFLVSDKMLLSEAIDYCKIHDAHLYAPSSEEKNEQLGAMLAKKYNSCVIPNIGHTEGK